MLDLEIQSPTKINNGFKAFKNYITNIHEELYAEIDSYVQVLEGLSRLTNQCFYLIDLYKGEILYVSDNPLFLCGLKPEEVKKMGSDFNKQFVSVEENKRINEIIRSWLSFLEDVPTEEKKSYTVQYDYYLKDKLICTSLTPVFLCKENKPWLVLCSTKISTSSSTCNTYIYKKNTSIYWNYSFNTKKWIVKNHIVLTDIEKQILRLSVQGRKESEISALIYRSKDGLKSIKRKMFKKMEVHNITEAVSYAIFYGLI